MTIITEVRCNHCGNHEQADRYPNLPTIVDNEVVRGAIAPPASWRTIVAHSGLPGWKEPLQSWHICPKCLPGLAEYMGTSPHDTTTTEPA